MTLIGDIGTRLRRSGGLLQRLAPVVRRGGQLLRYLPLRLGPGLMGRLPKGLYARSILIVVLPIVILQSVVAYVFMERHWQLLTRRLSYALTRALASLIKVIETYP